MRIEAAAYRGKPVSWDLISPWSRPGRMVVHTKKPIRVVADRSGALRFAFQEGSRPRRG